jgi:hypothetical protein
MGDYNFHVPQILGQEWVGLRNEDITFAPAVNIYELGHRFSTETSRTLSEARFYVNTFPSGRALGQVFLATIYAEGKEDATGPVQSVIIPCNAVLISGGTTGTVASVEDPSDNSHMVFPSTGSPSAQFFFALNTYSQQLNGKRILGVNFHYTLAAQSGTLGTAPIESLWGNLSVSDTSNGVVGLGIAEAHGSLIGISQVSVARIGEIDHWVGLAPNGTSERLPWRYQGLQDFEISSGPSSRIAVVYEHQTNAGWTGNLGYAALEVVYCEENRLYYGGKSFGASGFAAANQEYVLGANNITMRDTTLTANPVLAPGSYYMVISSADLGDCAGAVGLLRRKINLSQYPQMNGLRQLYAIPPHPGLQVNWTDTVGETFVREETFVLPQLSLHTSGGTMTEPHVYGRQAAAQVYGSITATQEVLDSVVGGAHSYPWVRYYARRFGNTTVPLRLYSPTISGSGQAVEISPVEFDLLAEIADGWKEVTLRFDTAPSMGTGTNPQWRWSATGELPGNRWEVLGVIAPALSGIPGNHLNQVVTAQRLGVATYGAPVSGAEINLGWVPGYSPPVSATTDDPSADAALLFAQDMQTVTGFSVAEVSQEVSGIGLDCGVDPCCIPTEIQYHRITWGLPANTGFAQDSFTRVIDPATDSWGVADSGQTWTQNNAGNVTYSVDGEAGVVELATTNNRTNVVDVGGPDQDVRAKIRTATALVSGSYRSGLAFRVSGIDDYYQARIVTSAGDITLQVTVTVAGVNTTLYQVSIPNLLPSTTAYRNLRVVMVGNRILAKLWSETEDEPGWQIDITDSTFATGNSAGSFVRDLGGNTTVTHYFDDFSVTPPDTYFGYYELQRMDTVETEWQTIMAATAPVTTGFNDYEARVGILSSYRIRAVDVYDFPGLWSSTVTNTLSEPGVTIGCEDGHLLIFTSNEEQDGSINLAYSSVWEEGRSVEESFLFSEAQFVQLQAMYNRDFFTAFRPTERGGERFSRTVLVQAAAIAPETLGDFTSLRDMAWANVSYICVRDEDGNRWFATVLVPGGRVLRDRRLYLAPIEIIEVTATPSQVNP